MAIACSKTAFDMFQRAHVKPFFMLWAACSLPSMRSQARPPSAIRAASCPHPPGPLSRTAGEGVNAPRSVLSRILPRWYATYRLLLPTRLWVMHSSCQAGEQHSAALLATLAALASSLHGRWGTFVAEGGRAKDRMGASKPSARVVQTSACLKASKRHANKRTVAYNNTSSTNKQMIAITTMAISIQITIESMRLR